MYEGKILFFLDPLCRNESRKKKGKEERERERISFEKRRQGRNGGWSN